jgi:hypothetical protein
MKNWFNDVINTDISTKYKSCGQTEDSRSSFMILQKKTFMDDDSDGGGEILKISLQNS